jgi:uncharacterized protein YbgA (DUF1722 family)/uncharacterized protein YbbK (DUF523 family)
MIENNQYSRPKVLVSKCLNLEACRYDGTMIKAPIIDVMKEYVDLIPVCPELAIGLSSPRDSLRLERINHEVRLIESKTGTDLTDKMVDFSNKYLNGILKNNIHGVILKSRSPSCGINDAKFYIDDRRLPFKVSGIFGNAVLEQMPNATIENEGRLLNLDIREHFYTSIFVKAEFDEVTSMKELVKFQTKHKYLLMAYHQSNQKEMGRLVANKDHLPFYEVLLDYKQYLIESLKEIPKTGKMINVLEHVYGYFKKELSDYEKKHFHSLLKEYKHHKIPVSVILHVLYSWVMRFDEQYLMNQSFFAPFPNELIELIDSGKNKEKKNETR